MLRLSHVHYKFTGGAEALLSDCNLHVKAGEWVALIGRSGAGKSTLGRICANLLQPSGGEVVRSAGSIGWLSQNPADSLIGATVAEDVAFAPRNQGLTSAALDARITHALAAVGLSAEFRQRDPVRLSGGERQLVALAGLIAMEPKLLVLDEPTAVIDIGARMRVLAAVQTAAQNGCAVIYITHNPVEAAIARRIAVLAHGSIITTSAAQQVLLDADALAAAGMQPPPLYALRAELASYGFALADAEMTITGMCAALQKLMAMQMMEGGGTPV